MIDEGLIGKDLEGSHHSLIEEFSWHLLGVTEKKKKNISHDSQCPSLDSNQEYPECEYKNVTAMPVCSVHTRYMNVHREHKVEHHIFLSFSFLQTPI
jgi:hypothetical protein